MSSQRNWPPETPGAPTGPGQSRTGDAPGPSRNEVFEGLADERRRSVLGVLLERSEAISERDLARELTTTPNNDSADDETLQTVRSTLRHRHLPSLESIPLIHWDREDGRVRATDHPAFEDEAIRRVIDTEADVDALLDALANERRRLVLAVLYTYGGPVDLATVAQKVSDLMNDGNTAGSADNTPEDVQVSLHHVHLPKLEEAGLVKAGLEDGAVEYIGHPDVDESWFTF